MEGQAGTRFSCRALQGSMQSERLSSEWEAEVDRLVPD